MKHLTVNLSKHLYRLIRPVLFLADSEKIHTRCLALGEYLGRSTLFPSKLWRSKSPTLKTTLHGIGFPSPIGLAAGFDYEARLTGITPTLGFGFSTIGTVTNHPYEGNTTPRLGRLARSRSLLVNKGFKNLGITATLQRLQGKTFTVPIGLSIGKTNTPEPMTQAEAVADIVTSFTTAEVSGVPFSYYELNISCPNLHGTVEFYSVKNLRALLTGVTGLKLTKPLFIKMPIEKTDEETMAMLKVISAYPVAGVIIGNLQKNRLDPSINQQEVGRYPVGNFSGKPTEKRSNELIRLAFKTYGQKMTIIGCGGVFSAQDAYAKIRLGSSLIQLITGLVYVGPQLPAQINLGLEKLLRRDGFANIAQAVGVDAR